MTFEKDYLRWLRSTTPISSHAAKIREDGFLEEAHLCAQLLYTIVSDIKLTVSIPERESAPFLEALQYQVDAWSGRSKPRFQLRISKIHLIYSPRIGNVSDIKLIRTDTTLDLSQKAEKRCFGYAARGRAGEGAAGCVSGEQVEGQQQTRSEARHNGQLGHNGNRIGNMHTLENKRYHRRRIFLNGCKLLRTSWV